MDEKADHGQLSFKRHVDVQFDFSGWTVYCKGHQVENVSENKLNGLGVVVFEYHADHRVVLQNDSSE